MGGATAEGRGGVVTGGVGVVGAEGAGSVEGLQPAGQSGSDASGGGDEGVGRQGGGQQQDSGEGVDGTLGDQKRVEIVRAGRQPEATAGLAGAGSHALEGAAVGSGAGADEFGADGVLVAVAADEDGVAAGVGVEDAVLAAALEQGGIEATGGGQEVTHGVPESVRGSRELQGGVLVGSGRAGRCGRAQREAGEAFEELDGGLEAAAARVHDEVDRAAAATVLAVVEELVAGDGEDGAGEFEAGRVAGVGTVAEPDGERSEGNVADAVGPHGPARSGRGSHLASSWQACSRCSAETVRAWSRAAARRA